MPAVVLQMSLSKTMKSEGRTSMTENMLIRAPLAMSIQSEPMISTSEYIATPKVAAKKPRALTVIEPMLVESAVLIADFLSAPPMRSSL